ncbi:MAG: RHS repeat protein [Planctomycetes bacterium]|nr:RHS repeat protein [Planctomycetota bacterium]
MSRQLRLRYRHDRGPEVVVGAAVAFAAAMREQASHALAAELPTSATMPALLARAIVGGDVRIPGRERLRSVHTEGGLLLLALDHDARDRLIRIEQPGGLVTELSWDDGGRLLAVHDETGCAVRMRYGGNGALTQIEYPGRRLFEYRYDDRGRLCACVFPDGRTLHNDYHGPSLFLRAARCGAFGIETSIQASGRLESLTVHGARLLARPDLQARLLSAPITAMTVADGRILCSDLGVLEERAGRVHCVMSITGTFATRPAGEVPGALLSHDWSTGGQGECARGPGGHLRWVRDPLGRRAVFHRLGDRKAVVVRPDGVGVLTRSRFGRAYRLRTDGAASVDARIGRGGWRVVDADGATIERSDRGRRVAVPGRFDGEMRGDHVRLRLDGTELLTAAGHWMRRFWFGELRLPETMCGVFAPTDGGAR